MQPVIILAKKKIVSMYILYTHALYILYSDSIFYEYISGPSGIV